MIGLAILAAVTFSPVRLEPPIKRVSPRVTDAVAGLSVRRREVAQVIWLDPREDVVALKVVDCDYSHVLVRLGPRSTCESEKFCSQRETRRLHKVTKHGIALGIKSKELKEKLSSPDYVHRMKASLIWRYAVKVDHEGADFAYLYNDYIIKGGKVVAIEVGYERVPGCGNTNFNPAKDWYQDEI